MYRVLIWQQFPTLSYGTNTTTTSFTYDATGHLLSTTDPLGHTTAYDSAGNPTSIGV
jgi:YD repeat-containing protein